MAPRVGGLLLEEYVDFPVGGVDDMAAWTGFMWLVHLQLLGILPLLEALCGCLHYVHIERSGIHMWNTYVLVYRASYRLHLLYIPMSILQHIR